MLRAIIIDDEESGVETIKILASRNQELVKIVASSRKPEQGIDLIEDYKPDIVLLDIRMPNMSGFELLTKLKFRDFKLVFTTAHKEYAIEAIKNHAHDYLLKPIDTEDFRKCLEEINTIINPQTSAKQSLAAMIEIQVKDGIVYLKQKDIVRLEASRSYTEFHMENGMRHVASRSLLEYEAKLDSKIFYRPHKSHIINIRKVQKFVNHEGFFALMSDGSMVDISKGNKDVFLERLKSI